MGVRDRVAVSLPPSLFPPSCPPASLPSLRSPTVLLSSPSGTQLQGERLPHGEPGGCADDIGCLVIHALVKVQVTLPGASLCLEGQRKSLKSRGHLACSVFQCELRDRCSWQREQLIQRLGDREGLGVSEEATGALRAA